MKSILILPPRTRTCLRPRPRRLRNRQSPSRERKSGRCLNDEALEGAPLLLRVG